MVGSPPAHLSFLKSECHGVHPAKAANSNNRLAAIWRAPLPLIVLALEPTLSNMIRALPAVSADVVAGDLSVTACEIAAVTRFHYEPAKDLISMFVDGLLATAKANLVTIGESTPLVQAARLLRPGTDILIVWNLQNELAGVVTKTDVVRRISHCRGASCTMELDRVMSREVFYCKPGDSLQWVWNEAKERRFKNIPLVDTQLRPIGLVTA